MTDALQGDAQVGRPAETSAASQQAQQFVRVPVETWQQILAALAFYQQQGQGSQGQPATPDARMAAYVSALRKGPPRAGQDLANGH